ncbi:MAG: hypothetical protein KGL39_18710 [Patescibacteria group bacterium]|nr:hypothetical protein [Patescibacteria group bacterium]
MNNVTDSGVATTFEVYLKDISADVDYGKVIDSSVAMTTNGPDSTFWWQSPMTDGLHVGTGNQIRDFAVNMFRSNNGDICDGHIAHTSVLWAAWSSNSGQRIGAAVEVEGGGVGSSPKHHYRRRNNAEVPAVLVGGQ